MHRIETSASHRLRRSALWATLLLALAFVGSAAQAQPGVQKVNRVTFDLDRNSGTISQNATTMTTNLPAPNRIRDSYRGRNITMRLAFQSSGSGRPQARFVQASASHNRVSCYIPSGTQSAPVRFTCSADATWLRSLTARTTVRIEVGGAGVSGKPTATWVINPN